MGFRGEDKAGVYFTVSVHLAVIILLLICNISSISGKRDSYLLDFTASAEDIGAPTHKEENEEDDLTFDEEIARRIEMLISGEDSHALKNIATDRSQQTLKDDRGTDAEKLYEDARHLAAELKDGIVPDEPDENYVVDGRSSEKESSIIEYSGPSVVSYSLDGRKASRLPVPAYGCYGGGMVTVLITVDNSGKVTDAKVQESTSSKDKCLRERAVAAARRSRFSVNAKAPAQQHGDILYQFIAQ